MMMMIKINKLEKSSNRFYKIPIALGPMMVNIYNKILAYLVPVIHR